jgi:hypothetical protein
LARSIMTSLPQGRQSIIARQLATKLFVNG